MAEPQVTKTLVVDLCNIERKQIPLTSSQTKQTLPPMNIPLEIARAQGIHGAKGGRPKLDLTEEQRLARRRDQIRRSKLRRAAIDTEKPKTTPSRETEFENANWLAAKYEKIRMDLGQSRVELAKKLGVTRQTIHRRESGQTPITREAQLALEGVVERMGFKMARQEYAEPQPGRNDPCACGSGRKFKKCCGR